LGVFTFSRKTASTQIFTFKCNFIFTNRFVTHFGLNFLEISCDFADLGIPRVFTFGYLPPQGFYFVPSMEMSSHRHIRIAAVNTHSCMCLLGSSREVCSDAANVRTQPYRHGSVRRPMEASGSCNQGTIMHIVLNPLTCYKPFRVNNVVYFIITVVHSLKTPLVCNNRYKNWQKICTIWSGAPTPQIYKKPS